MITSQKLFSSSFFNRFYRAMIIPGILLSLVFGFVGLTSPAQPFPADPTSPGYDLWVRIIVAFVVGPISIGMGWLIARRNPENLIGPVILLWGCAANAEFNSGYLPPSLAALAGPYLGILANPAMFMMLSNFPTGTGVTLGWDRVVAGYTFFVMGLNTLRILVSPYPYGLMSPNPFAIESLLPYSDFITTISDIGLMLLLALSIGLSIVRYRRSSETTRKQMRWLLIMGLYYALFAVLGFSLDWGAGLGSAGITLFSILGLAAISVPSISVGIAILFHRLWDIDIIIRRTLQYTILTGMLALLYAASVLVLQTGVKNFTGAQSQWVIVVSTLVIAALFNPLRVRIQNFIDRRFYRNKYDADLALAHFAATTRDEVALDRITGSLMDLVMETMQPEKASLWLVRRKTSQPDQEAQA